MEEKNYSTAQQVNPSDSPETAYKPRPEHRQYLYKSSAIAGLLSLFPGLGHLYLGYYKHAFLLLGAFILPILLLRSFEETTFTPMFGMLLTFLYFYNIIDSVRKAKLNNLVINGISQAKLPEDSISPGIAGSFAGGIFLVFLGLILFLHTKFGMSLAWLEQWWPLALVFGGFYLIYKDYIEKGPNSVLGHIMGKTKTSTFSDKPDDVG